MPKSASRLTPIIRRHPLPHLHPEGRLFLSGRSGPRRKARYLHRLHGNFELWKGKTSSGEVKIIKDLDISLEGADVLIVEDIIDSGVTLNYLTSVLKTRKPKSVRVATLLDKPERRIRHVDVAYVGFRIPDEFVVGYGLDYAEKYRNLREVCVLEP